MFNQYVEHAANCNIQFNVVRQEDLAYQRSEMNKLSQNWMETSYQVPPNRNQAHNYTNSNSSYASNSNAVYHHHQQSHQAPTYANYTEPNVDYNVPKVNGQTNEFTTQTQPRQYQPKSNEPVAATVPSPLPADNYVKSDDSILNEINIDELLMYYPSVFDEIFYSNNKPFKLNTIEQIKNELRSFCK